MNHSYFAESGESMERSSTMAHNGSVCNQRADEGIQVLDFNKSCNDNQEGRWTPSSLGWVDYTSLGRYKFIVVKGEEPYFELIPGWDPTPETPSRVYLDPPSDSKKNFFPCQYPGSCAGKTIFGRPVDLERHYRNVHASPDQKDEYSCDYWRCQRMREPFTRKDHFRDHLSDYHKEDLRCAKGENKYDRKKWIQLQSAWIVERKSDNKWWRCPKCLIRVDIGESGYECPGCEHPCDRERSDRLEATRSKPAGKCPEASCIEQGLQNCHARRYYSRHICAQRWINASSQTRGRGVGWISDSPSRPAAICLPTALLMGATYQWLNHKMSLNYSSTVMRFVTAKVIWAIPLSISRFLSSYHGGNAALLSAFGLSTAIFTATTLVWATGKTQKTATKMISLIIAVLGLTFWMVMGVNAEELILVFLPLCISIGIICTAGLTFHKKKRGVDEDNQIEA